MKVKQLWNKLSAYLLNSRVVYSCLLGLRFELSNSTAGQTRDLLVKMVNYLQCYDPHTI